MKLVMVTIDCLEPVSLADWYISVFGGEVIENMDGFFVSVGMGGFRVAFQKVEAVTPGKNRVHLDFHTTEDLKQTVDEILAKGAKRKADYQMAGLDWVTLEDPEGNVFDVVSTS
jgi:hypothetical protein